MTQQGGEGAAAASSFAVRSAAFSAAIFFALGIYQKEALAALDYHRLTAMPISHLRKWMPDILFIGFYQLFCKFLHVVVI